MDKKIYPSHNREGYYTIQLLINSIRTLFTNLNPGSAASSISCIFLTGKQNGMYPEDPSKPDDGSGDISDTGDSKHVCEPDYELKHPKKNFPFYI